MKFLFPAIKGLLFMASLIIAIGPQNAFLLRQAVRREQAWLTASIFLFGDASMVLLGGFGIGLFLEQSPLLKIILTVLGAAYIFWFGVGVFHQFLQPKALEVSQSNMDKKNIVPKAFAVTFLNPHVMFDTILLVGTMTLQFRGISKIAFMSGAILTSTIWFFGIAWAGQRLAPFLSRPGIWRVIDGVIVVIMFFMSAMLGFDAWKQWQTL